MNRLTIKVKAAFFIFGGQDRTKKEAMMDEQVLLKAEASDFLKVPPKTLEYFVATNQIPFGRVGKRGVRFLKSRLIEWLLEREGLPLPLENRAGNSSHKGFRAVEGRTTRGPRTKRKKKKN